MYKLGRTVSLGAIFLACLMARGACAQSWISVQGGEFVPLYGSQKKSVIVENFEINEYPVTNAEFLTFVTLNPAWRKDQVKRLFVDATYLRHWASLSELGAHAPPQSPVVNVSWFAAKAYCDMNGGRLPTVDEWEYIASREIQGVDSTRLILDWYGYPTPDVLPPITSGLKNCTGVSALHGLIWEWVLDFNSTMVTGESRGDGALDKSLYCGAGSVGAANPEDYAAFMRFAFRSSLKAKYTVNNLGFRCVKL